MPVVIGSQSDVPNVGDPIVSPWYQDTAKKIVHTFASTAARDAWVSPPNGAMCITLDTNTMWQRAGGVWGLPPRAARGVLSHIPCPTSDQPGFGTTPADIAGSIIGGGTTTPARMYAVSMLFVVTSTATCVANLYLVQNPATTVARTIQTLTAGQYVTFAVRHPLTGLSGSPSYKAQIGFSAGTGTVLNMNGYMMFEDLGTI